MDIDVVYWRECVEKRDMASLSEINKKGWEEQMSEEIRESRKCKENQKPGKGAIVKKKMF